MLAALDYTLLKDRTLMKGCNIYDRRNKTKGGDEKEETKQ